MSDRLTIADCDRTIKPSPFASDTGKIPAVAMSLSESLLLTNYSWLNFGEELWG
ncbi:hypothetical protein [Microcoleus sp. FACHB-831]|uniref:hypothetical protein n=1 Tax=Microcoleus sp. FACHB-831 TaxID=2692827 RepID=UPI001689CAF3|nr:hypothetical protein [Microcoleus sp. FACHB-831]